MNVYVTSLGKESHAAEVLVEGRGHTNAQWKKEVININYSLVVNIEMRAVLALHIFNLFHVPVYIGIPTT
jgi:hypothetical protein